MKRTRSLFVITLALLWLPQPVQAEAAGHVVISEVQTGTTISSSQEFVELYNPTNQPIALDGWQLHYHPAGATSNWTNRTSGGLHGSIPANGYYLIAPTTYLSQADAPMSSGMAAGGGSVQLVDSGANVVDLVGWGTGVVFAGTVAPAPAADGSLERLPGASNPTGGDGIDTDNNLADFALRALAEPQSGVSPIELPGDVIVTPAPTTTGSSTPPVPQPGSSSSPTQPILINELLIDPVSPQSDSKDEFIELYNPNATPVDLAGYVLKTGSNFHDSYTLPSMTIVPHGYLPLYSLQTKLSLTNTGGAAELLDPTGAVIDQSADYDGSLPGLSFSRFGDDWQWTEALTPGALNQFVAPPAAEAASSTAKTSSSKKVSSKPASAKTSKVKAPKTVKAKATKAGTLVASDQQKSGLGAKWLIIGLATLTLGYAIYEFRYDLQNYLVIARRHFGARRQTRTAAKRR